MNISMKKKNKKEFPLKKDCTTKATSHNMQKITITQTLDFAMKQTHFYQDKILISFVHV